MGRRGDRESEAVLKIVIYRPHEPAEERELEEKLTLTEMQELVGGYIQLMPWVKNKVLVPKIKKPSRYWWMIADEDGRHKQLEPNSLASLLIGYPIVGVAVVGDYPFS